MLKEFETNEEMNVGRKRMPALEDAARYSLLVPQQLDSRLQKIADERGVSLSELLRNLLEEGVEVKGRVTITDSMQQKLKMASMLSGLKEEAIVQLILSKHLAEFIKEKREESAILDIEISPKKQQRD